MKDNKIMYYNWNRISLLTGIERSKLTEKERIELTMRVDLQNGFAMSEKPEVWLPIVEESLTPTIIKSVDKYMKRHK